MIDIDIFMMFKCACVLREVEGHEELTKAIDQLDFSKIDFAKFCCLRLLCAGSAVSVAVQYCLVVAWKNCHIVMYMRRLCSSQNVIGSDC